MKPKNNHYPTFSFFNAPVSNKYPLCQAGIKAIYRGLVSSYYKQKIECLRNTPNQRTKQRLKLNLDYVTFAGVFSKRDEKSLVKASGYTVIDFDNIKPEHMEVIRNLLLSDKMFESQLLFLSPSGNGLKWVVEIDLDKYPDYQLNFTGIVQYLKATYPEFFNADTNYIDTSGKDISRACFMSYDPHAFIHPKYNYNDKKKI